VKKNKGSVAYRWTGGAGKDRR